MENLLTDNSHLNVYKSFLGEMVRDDRPGGLEISRDHKDRTALLINVIPKRIKKQDIQCLTTIPK